MDTTPQPTLEYAHLTGEKIILRPVSMDDMAAAYALIHDRREITDWLLWDGPQVAEDMASWYGTWADRGPHGADYHFAMCERESLDFCGTIGLRFSGHAYQGDLGYWLGVDKWGRGLMTEAVSMLTWLAFERLDTQLLYALVFQGNTASERVLTKCAYEHDPAGQTKVQKNGKPHLEEFYALSRSGWQRAGSPGQPQEFEVRVR